MRRLLLLVPIALTFAVGPAAADASASTSSCRGVEIQGLIAFDAITAQGTGCDVARRVASAVGHHVVDRIQGPFDACTLHRTCRVGGFHCIGHPSHSHRYAVRETCTGDGRTVRWHETDNDPG